jgi:hypothetical protein
VPLPREVRVVLLARGVEAGGGGAGVGVGRGAEVEDDDMMMIPKILPAVLGGSCGIFCFVVMVLVPRVQASL